MIPPAFPKVWKPMSECNFQKLKNDTYNPAYLDISYDHHLKPPSE